MTSFLLFSLFFGAGNLIFPPFLGAEAGKNMPIAIIGFLITAVILPVLGVVIVAKFKGLDKLASRVNPKFALVFTIIILLSIGPGLGIPRAASVPFEMAIMPYLPENLNPKIFLLIYSLIFFALALWLSLSPLKLPKRVGYILTPTLLILIVTLFVTFMVNGTRNIGEAAGGYIDSSFFVGFNEGYQTMDTIAALNFGLVIATTLNDMGVSDNRKVVGYTVKTGIFAGVILSAVYLMLAYMGMAVSKIYEGSENGAVILRGITKMLYGDAGAIILATIFTLACLTTCVGLITSISKYFSDTFKKFKYTHVAIFITVVSFLICNLGLNMILSISIPVLNFIYPVSIVLIILGFFDNFYKNNKLIYPLTIALTALISFIYSLHHLKVPLGFLDVACSYILGYELGFGWVSFAIFGVLISGIVALIKYFINKKAANAELKEE